MKDLIVFSTIRSATGSEFFTAPKRPLSRSDPAARSPGFRTGPLGLGHVVLQRQFTRTIDRLMAFYRDTLGFRLTDYYDQSIRRALPPSQPAPPQPRFHPDRQECHASRHDGAFQLRRRRPGYDLALRREGRVGVTLGRHTSDYITSFYLHPVRLHGRVRLGRALDRRRRLAGVRAQGRPEHVGPRPRLAVRKKTTKKARALRPPERGLAAFAAPVQVMDGNYDVMARRLSVVGCHEGKNSRAKIRARDLTIRN